MSITAKQIWITLFIFWCILLFHANASDIISGKIIDQYNQTFIDNVMIRVDHTPFITFSDDSGYFELPINNIPENATVYFSKTGYYTLLYELKDMVPQKYMSIEMIPGNSDEILIVNLGSILVLDNKNLLSSANENTYTITGNQLSHSQAIHLGNALEFIPGTNISGKFDLSGIAMPVLRYSDPISVANTYDLLGTTINLYGIELSNRLNLNNNVFAPGEHITSTTGMGIDLRMIPVMNIKKIEIYPDIAPAELGNYTNAYIKIESEPNPSKHILRINQYPHINHFGIQTGFSVHQQHDFSIIATATEDERNPYYKYDNYDRFSIHVLSNHSFPGKKITFQNNLYYIYQFEKYKNTTNNSNYYDLIKDIALSSSIRKKLTENSSIRSDFSFRVKNQNSYNNEYTISSGHLISSLEEEGSGIGELLYGSYMAETTIRGKEVQSNFKLKSDIQTRIRESRLQSTVGLEYLFEGNLGEGLNIDPTHPPLSYLQYRDVNFKNLPLLHHFSVFTDQQMLHGNNQFNIGLRIDAYNIKRNRNAFIAQNGIFINPRLSLRIPLGKEIQLRVGAGQTSTPPALNDLYPWPYFLTIQDSSQTVSPILSSFSFKRGNPNLKGYTQRKFNISLEINTIPFFFIRSNAYLSQNINLPVRRLSPQTAIRKNWLSWPDQYIIEDTLLISNPSIYSMENKLNSSKSGIEIEITTERFTEYNLRYKAILDLSVNHYDYGLMSHYSNLIPVTINGNPNTVIPYYDSFKLRNTNIGIKHFLELASDRLGLWMTLVFFHKPRNSIRLKENLQLYPKYFYIDGEYRKKDDVPLSESEMEKFKLSAQDFSLLRTHPAQYFFNLSLSKRISKGFDISFSINNFLDIHQYRTVSGIRKVKYNPDINFSLETNIQLNHLF